MKEWIDRLEREHVLTEDEFTALIEGAGPAEREELAARARETARRWYGRDIYIRGLIEFTNYCRNDCYYCGIRRSNQKAARYRLTEEEILSCCQAGYGLGFRTFVLQGGEDGFFTDERLAALVRRIKTDYPDCAVTLSVGERSRESYQLLFEAGADRYLLRHETADEEHYARLHPAELSGAHRKQCLRWLKEIGYQVGSGFMVGSPGQTARHLARDLLFLWELQPQMVGIGPFLRHQDTPFAGEPSGTLEQTLLMLSILRLMFPNVLLPATTALGTIHPQGREMGVLAGANVVMPNLSPQEVRGKYLLYDNKIATGEEAAEGRRLLEEQMARIGYRVVVARGDWKPAAPDGKGGNEDGLCGDQCQGD